VGNTTEGNQIILLQFKSYLSIVSIVSGRTELFRGWGEQINNIYRGPIWA